MQGYLTVGLTEDVDLELMPDPKGTEQVGVVHKTTPTDIEVSGAAFDRMTLYLVFASLDELESYGQALVDLARIEKERLRRDSEEQLRRGNGRG